MRYLAEDFALGALRRGRPIEQFLGPAEGEVPGIRWVEIVPGEAGYRVVLHVCGDVGGERFCDLVEFPPLKEGDEEDFGEQVAVAAEAADALVAARDAVGAGVDRWVNQGLRATRIASTCAPAVRPCRGRESGFVRPEDTVLNALRHAASAHHELRS